MKATAHPGTDPPPTALRNDLLVLVGAALVVQLVFPYRHDWPAHLVGGGSAMLVIAAVAPRRLKLVTPAAAFAALVALSWVTEEGVFGPFDLVDISFTLAGALLTSRATERIGQSNRQTRTAAAVWGAALIVAALAFRYGTSIGPT
ncbi:MAG: hypothetical protein KDA94_01865 [Acidimicrobiales bacterium]|nr:hypothetical protein [Acidimicrobiales bacterium]